VVEFLYAAAALAVVPGLLGLFHWLTRVPPRREVEEEHLDAGSIAEEAERWLRSRR